MSMWPGWNDQTKNDGGSMSVPDEVRREAERTAVLVRKKLFEIMDLQAEIDTLLIDPHPRPSGSKNWQYACLEALQRLVLMRAIQFILYEPAGRVKGDDQFKVAADKMIEVVVAQLKTLKTKKTDW